MQILPKYLNGAKKMGSFKFSLEEAHRCVYLSHLSLVFIISSILGFPGWLIHRNMPIVLIWFLFELLTHRFILGNILPFPCAVMNYRFLPRFFKGESFS